MSSNHAGRRAVRGSPPRRPGSSGQVTRRGAKPQDEGAPPQDEERDSTQADEAAPAADPEAAPSPLTNDLSELLLPLVREKSLLPAKAPNEAELVALIIKEDLTSAEKIAGSRLLLGDEAVERLGDQHAANLFADRAVAMRHALIAGVTAKAQALLQNATRLLTIARGPLSAGDTLVYDPSSNDVSVKKKTKRKSDADYAKLIGESFSLPYRGKKIRRSAAGRYTLFIEAPPDGSKFSCSIKIVTELDDPELPTPPVVSFPPAAGDDTTGLRNDELIEVSAISSMLAETHLPSSPSLYTRFGLDKTEADG